MALREKIVVDVRDRDVLLQSKRHVDFAPDQVVADTVELRSVRDILYDRAAQLVRAELQDDPTRRGYAAARTREERVALLTEPFLDDNGVPQKPRLSTIWDQVPYVPNTIDVDDFAELET